MADQRYNLVLIRAWPCFRTIPIVRFVKKYASYLLPHELTHLLLDDGYHSDEEGNLMGLGSGYSLTEEQCSKMINNALLVGLL